MYERQLNITMNTFIYPRIQLLLPLSTTTSSDIASTSLTKTRRKSSGHCRDLLNHSSSGHGRMITQTMKDITSSHEEMFHNDMNNNNSNKDIYHSDRIDSDNYSGKHSNCICMRNKVFDRDDSVTAPNDDSSEEFACTGELSSCFSPSPLQSVQVIVDKSSYRHEIIIMDPLATTDIPIAICKRMYSEITPFKVYTTKPNYHNQYPAHAMYNETLPLYKYADIQTVTSNSNSACTSCITNSRKSLELVVHRKAPMYKDVDVETVPETTHYIVVAAATTTTTPPSSSTTTGQLVILASDQSVVSEVETTAITTDDNNDNKSCSKCTLLKCVTTTTAAESSYGRQQQQPEQLKVDDPFVVLCLGSIYQYFAENELKV
jgi:hypothetical protein